MDNQRSKTFYSPAMKRNLGVSAVGLIWLVAIGCGMGSLYNYQTRPGVPAHALPHWPSTSQIRLSSRQPTLLMFVHPRCPCSRSSLGNLSQIVAKNQGKVSVYVIFTLPNSGSSDWTDTDLCRTAKNIHGVTVIFDAHGVEAKRFGARTSGQVILYDAGGRLQFSGGITSGRSHFGDSAGSDSVTSLLRSQNPRWRSTPVFGCALFD